MPDLYSFRSLLSLGLVFAVALGACAPTVDGVGPADNGRADLGEVLRWEQAPHDSGDGVTFTGYGAGDVVEVELDVSYNDTVMAVAVFNLGFGQGELLLDLETMEVLEDTLPDDQITVDNMFEILAMASDDSRKSAPPMLSAAGDFYNPTNNDCLDGKVAFDWVPRTCGELQNDTFVIIGISGAAVLVGFASTFVSLPAALAGLLIEIGLGGAVVAGITILATSIPNTFSDCFFGSEDKPVYWCHEG